MEEDSHNDQKKKKNPRSNKATARYALLELFGTLSTSAEDGKSIGTLGEENTACQHPKGIKSVRPALFSETATKETSVNSCSRCRQV